MARKAKQRWDIGSIFLIPLDDGRAVAGQVLARERDVLNGVSVAIFDLPVSISDKAPDVLAGDMAFSTLMVKPNFLDDGRWRVIGSADLALDRSRFPHEHLREAGYVGATIEGSALVEDFVNAFYGLRAWDDWADPNFLDQYLIDPGRKPVGRLVFVR